MRCSLHVLDACKAFASGRPKNAELGQKNPITLNVWANGAQRGLGLKARATARRIQDWRWECRASHRACDRETQCAEPRKTPKHGRGGRKVVPEQVPNRWFGASCACERGRAGVRLARAEPTAETSGGEDACGEVKRTRGLSLTRLFVSLRRLKRKKKRKEREFTNKGVCVRVFGMARGWGAGYHSSCAD